jgi:hypothetical protein
MHMKAIAVEPRKLERARLEDLSAAGAHDGPVVAETVAVGRTAP